MTKRIAICTVQVPFVTGGAETLARNLKDALVRTGYDAEIITVPFRWHPTEGLVDQMLIWRMLDLREASGGPVDLVITLKFPAFYVRHPNKVAWILHQHRQAYDLWDTAFCDFSGSNAQRIRDLITANDTTVFRSEMKQIFTISIEVANRLSYFNGVQAEPLYHPPDLAPYSGPLAYDPFVLAPGRHEPLKRQNLIVEAAARLDGSLTLVVTGEGPMTGHLREMCHRLNLDDRVRFVGVVGKEDLIRLYSLCRAVFYGPVREDYGYVTLEAFLHSKPVITFADSGGPIEFVRDGVNGWVVPPDDQGALVATLQGIARTDAQARAMGAVGRERVESLGLSWEKVVKRLTATL